MIDVWIRVRISDDLDELYRLLSFLYGKKYAFGVNEQLSDRHFDKRFIQFT
jgi:hypothetical protein